MNEVTKIHLGRQAFAISADAHKELRDYLDAIRKHVHDDDVVQEIELRMSELLAERGLKGGQVILPADVNFLKEQLGAAKDFAEDQEQDSTDMRQTDTKRLFRDTDNAMLAGVASGLANYFGVDPLLIRLLFVIATFAGGWGILIYLVLWILVPEAKTPSERLIMFGKPVTVDNLKEVVKHADVKGAAKRANSSLAGMINTAFSLSLKAVGALFVTFGLTMLLGLISAVLYVILRSGVMARESVFPIGSEEHALVYIAAGVLLIISIFVVLFGVSIFRRKWPIRAWATGTLIGLLLISLATTGAMTAGIVPQVRDRYNASFHTTTQKVQPFNSVDLGAATGNVDVEFQTANTYYVTMRYYDHPDLQPVKINVKDNTLAINTIGFNSSRDCQALCLPNNYELTITVYSPSQPQTVFSATPRPMSLPVRRMLTPAV